MGAKSKRLQEEGLLRDAGALNPQQEAAIESLSDDQVQHLIDLFKHFRTNHPDVSFSRNLGRGPSISII